VLHDRAYRLQEFTHDWLKNVKYSVYWLLYIIQDESTMVKYVIEVLRPFQLWMFSMSKWHMVTRPHIITVYNEMFDYVVGVIQALATKKTQWMEDLFFAVTFVWQKLSK
jgi:hypothetical protein